MADRKESAGKEPNLVLFRGRLMDDGYVLVKCPKGHESVVIHDERRHDVLFESACHALLNGYEREAVSGFAASLERVHEFFVRVLARKGDMAPAVFDATWKMMSKQSERQFGCFAMLYAMETGTPYVVDNKTVAFRNSVIHQGYIPKAEETWGFANNVFTIKTQLMKLLNERYSGIVGQIVNEDLDKARASAPKRLPQLTVRLFSVYVPPGSNIGHDIENFPDYIRALRTRWDPPKEKSASGVAS
jgi:hypothetical protein